MLTLIDDFVNDGNIPPEGSNVYLSCPPWVNLVAATSEFYENLCFGVRVTRLYSYGDHHGGYETDAIMFEVTKYYINYNIYQFHVGYETPWWCVTASHSCRGV